MTEQEDILARFMEELRKPTGDGAQKRSRNEKPPWYLDNSHMAAVWSHFMRHERGELVDPDSGAHPFVHAAWRLLAIACKETGNVPVQRGLAVMRNSGENSSQSASAACSCDPVRPDGKPWYAHQPGCSLRDVRQVCPYCGRYVDMFNHPDYGRVMMGHRPVTSHTPETPWCEGGGRSV